MPDDLQADPKAEAFGVEGGNLLWKMILESFVRAAEADSN